MLGAVLDIHLMPQQIVVKHRQRRLLKVTETVLAVCSMHCENDPVEWAVTACHELLDKNKLRGALQVAFSDKWVRYDLFSLGETDLNDEEAGLLARAQFDSQYPDANDWPLRLTHQGKQLLVAGVNPSLISAIEQLAADSGCRLVSLEPWLSRVWNQYEKTLSNADGWLLFIEPGMLIVAFLKQGVLTSLHCQHCDDDQRESSAQLMLNRQSALLGYSAGAVQIFSYSAIPLELQEPWRCGQYIIVSPSEKNPTDFSTELQH